MSKSVTIPSTENPWVCCINGTYYSYPAGSTQTVPDAVAELIDTINAATPVAPPAPGTAGQVWTRTSDGEGWKDVPKELPTWSSGKYLKSTASGCTWATAPTPNHATISDYGTVQQAAQVQVTHETDLVGRTLDDVIVALQRAGIMSDGN